jgi:hypothetical protein
MAEFVEVLTCTESLMFRVWYVVLEAKTSVTKGGTIIFTWGYIDLFLRPSTITIFLFDLDPLPSPNYRPLLLPPFLQPLINSTTISSRHVAKH